MSETRERELIVARALARRHGLGDHMGDEHLKPWLRDARTAIEALSASTQVDAMREALEEARAFVVIHGPAAAFPDLLAKIDAAILSDGATG